MAKIYLLLGGNMGDRIGYLNKAGKMITERIGKIQTASSLYETEPWGFENENAFLNQIVVAHTLLEPEQVLNPILQIENELGRTRTNEQYSSRTIDIDILFYDDIVISSKDLTIPHPRLHERRFTLEPLAEIDPGMTHPVFGKTISELLEECDDKMEVRKL